MKRMLSPEEVPAFVQGWSIVADLTHNINGMEMTRYEIEDVSTDDYTIMKVKRASDHATLDEYEAKRYLKAMTGSEFLPRYNFRAPANSYFFAYDFKIWKPQFDDENGLLIYLMMDLGA